MKDKKFQHVAVLYGGPSSEREVSLRSGAAVAAGLRTAGYDVTAVDVTGWDVQLPPGIEAAFIALHGAFGEDGTLQELLEKRGVPYTGSDPAGSRNAFDKRLSKDIFVRAGVPTPDYEILTDPGRRRLALPVVTKPPREGSSIGVQIVMREEEWAPAFAATAQHDPEVLVEQFIPGRELTVGIVGDEALPVIEIVAPDGNYDFDAKYKYTKGKTQYLVPAPITPEQQRQCQDYALRAFKALGCRGLSRLDFRLDAAGRLYLLENNTIPGFTETSLLPKAARVRGWEFPDLCDRILQMAQCGRGAQG